MEFFFLFLNLCHDSAMSSFPVTFSETKAVHLYASSDHRTSVFFQLVHANYRLWHGDTSISYHYLLTVSVRLQTGR